MADEPILANEEFFDPERPVLELLFHAEHQFDMGQVGRMLVDLDADYHRMFKRRLTLVRIETGSLLAQIAEQVTAGAMILQSTGDIAGSLERLVGFGQMLQDGFRSLKKQNEPSNSWFSDLSKALPAITKFAAQNGSDVDIKARSHPKHGDALSFKVTSHEAKMAHGKLLRMKSEGSPKIRERAAAALPRPPHDNLDALPSPDTVQREAPTTNASRLALESLGALSRSAPSSDVRILVDAIAKMFKEANELDELENLAKAMDDNKRPEIAKMLRAHLPPKEYVHALPAPKS